MATCAKFARIANYSCEFGNTSHIFLKNCLWRMWSSLASTTNGHILANASLAGIQIAFGKFGKFRNIYKLARFMYKTLILYVLNGLPYSPSIRQTRHSFGEFKFGEYYKGSQFGEFESGESERFPKMAILASTRIRQNWQIFGEYSNSTNSPASDHCLVKTLITKPKISFIQ